MTHSENDRGWPGSDMGRSFLGIEWFVVSVLRMSAISCLRLLCPLDASMNEKLKRFVGE